MSAIDPYDMLGGEAGVRRLVDRFYDHMLAAPEAATIRAMHADDLEPMRRKLTWYLCEWFGGPNLYSAETGTRCLTRPHARYAIGQDERDQWLGCMHAALREVGAADELRAALEQPFFRIADVMVNR